MRLFLREAASVSFEMGEMHRPKCTPKDHTEHCVFRCQRRPFLKNIYAISTFGENMNREELLQYYFGFDKLKDYQEEI